MTVVVLEVRNIRGVRSAKLPLVDGITFLAGRNRAGKTSMLTALGALLSGERAPMTGIIKFDAEHIVQRGEKGAWATLGEDDDNRVAGVWNVTGTATITTNGKPLSCSRLCAGLDLFSELDTTERLKLLATALEAIPTLDQLSAECKLAPPEAMKKLKAQVEAGLWDGAHATCDGEAKQAMGAWRQITGKTWTAKGGKEWQPENLPEARDEEFLIKLRTLAQELKDNLAATAGGISPEEKAKLEELAQDQGAAKKRLDAFREQLEKMNEERQRASLKVKQTPNPAEPPPTCACPECGSLLDVSIPLQLKPASRSQSREEIVAIKKAWIDAKAAESTAFSGYAEMKKNVDSASAHFGNCQNAAGRLESFDTGSFDAGQQHDFLQAQLDGVISQGKALTQWLDAKAIDQQIRMWVELRAQCAPDGLRRAALKKKLAGFNARLAQWGQDLDGLVIRVDEDMGVRDGNDEPYRMLSGAEKWLSDVLIMLAVAEIEKAPIVVIDEGNQLDEYLRAPLIAKVLEGQPRMVVVACAVGYADKAPQLAKWNLGKTWWVEDGGLTADYQQQAAE